MNLCRWDLLAVVAMGLGHPLKKDQFPDCNLLDRQSNQNIPIMSEYFFLDCMYFITSWIWFGIHSLYVIISWRCSSNVNGFSSSKRTQHTFLSSYDLNSLSLENVWDIRVIGIINAYNDIVSLTLHYNAKLINAGLTVSLAILCQKYGNVWAATLNAY